MSAWPLRPLWGTHRPGPSHWKRSNNRRSRRDRAWRRSRRAYAARRPRWNVDSSASNPIVTLGSDVSISPGGTLEHVPAVDLDPAHVILVQSIPEIGDRNAFAAQARYGAALEISKSLYDFGRTALAVEAARAEQAAASASDRATRRQLLDDVRVAYLTWLGATEMAAISEQAVAEAEARHKRVVDLVGEGEKPAADISPVASDEALARLEAARSRADVENARIMLEAAVGGGLPADAEPDRRALQIDLPSSSAGGPSRESADAAVDAVERQRDAARATASMYDHLHTPVISANAQVGIRVQNPITGGGLSGVFPTYRVGVSMSVPLSDGGSASANANVARAQAEELAARSRELSQARQSARSRAEADAAAAQERLRIARELLALSERRVRDAEERYEQARGPIEAIAEASAMRRRANMEIVLGEIATARARYTLQER